MNRLYHLLIAHTEYNLHSPFIFDLYTQVINTRVKGHFGGTCYEQIYKLINHFSAHRIWLQSPDKHAEHAISLANKHTTYVSTPQEAEFIIATQPELIPTFQPHNKVIIFIIHPHHNKSTEKEWYQLYTRLHARVSIDLYHSGILFMLSSLSPQKFILR